MCLFCQILCVTNIYKKNQKNKTKIKLHFYKTQMNIKYFIQKIYIMNKLYILIY